MSPQNPHATPGHTEHEPGFLDYVPQKNAFAKMCARRGVALQRRSSFGSLQHLKLFSIVAGFRSGGTTSARLLVGGSSRNKIHYLGSANTLSTISNREQARGPSASALCHQRVRSVPKGELDKGCAVLSRVAGTCSTDSGEN